MRKYRYQYKHLVVLFADVSIAFLAFLLAQIVKDDFQIIQTNIQMALMEAPFILLSYILIFELFGMYKSIWRYASIEELVRGAFANFAAIIIAYLVQAVLGIVDFNFSLYFVAFFLIASGTIGMRLSYRFFRYYTTFRQDVSSLPRTLIIGAGQAGVMMLDEIRKNNDFEKHVVGFVDDNPSLVHKYIKGIPVLGTASDIETIVIEEKIDIIVVAIPSLNQSETKALLNKIEKTGCKIKIMPPFYEMIESNEEMFKIRDVSIDDLLGRDPIVLEKEGIKEYLENKTVLVTGGGGSIGSEIVRQIRLFSPKHIIILDIYENNAYDLQMEIEGLYRRNECNHFPKITVLIASIRDENRLEEVFNDYQPEVVFHAAAHKHVPLMEVSPKEAIKNNVFGTYKVAKIADKYHVERFVLISTDKAVNPTNIMGATKRMAERVVMAISNESKTNYAIVRFGNVLGSNGSVIPLFKKQIKNGGPVTVTHPKIIRYFMTIPEACQLVIQAGAYANGGKIFVLDMGEQVNILSLAEKLIRLSGFEPYKEIPIVFTGLRPGEKMYEELLIDKDKVSKTNNDKIYVEPNNSEKLEDICKELDEIKAALHSHTNNMIIALFKEYIKTYQ